MRLNLGKKWPAREKEQKKEKGSAGPSLAGLSEVCRLADVNLDKTCRLIDRLKKASPPLF
jgi:hypothetical protein